MMDVRCEDIAATEARCTKPVTAIKKVMRAKTKTGTLTCRQPVCFAIVITVRNPGTTYIP